MQILRFLFLENWLWVFYRLTKIAIFSFVECIPEWSINDSISLQSQNHKLYLFANLEHIYHDFSHDLHWYNTHIMFLTWPNIRDLIDNVKHVFRGGIMKMENLQPKLYTRYTNYTW